jgi:rubrerythrin
MSKNKIQYSVINQRTIMSQGNVDHEIWEYAIQREIEAYHFYMALSEIVTSQNMKQTLKELAKEELEHKDKLELEILKTGHVVRIGQEKPELSLENYVDSNLGSLANMEYKDILVLAIQKEEASFRTYVNMVSLVHDQKSREALMAIAQEEVKHKYRFEIEYDLLSKDHK